MHKILRESLNSDQTRRFLPDSGTQYPNASTLQYQSVYTYVRIHPADHRSVHCKDASIYSKLKAVLN